MKRILQRGKHLWNAKGRHGTHSPFVYAFVEQVMRRKIQFPLGYKSESKLSQKQINLIGRTLQYLKQDVIYIDETLCDGSEALKDACGFAAFKALNEDYRKEGFETAFCIICSPTIENITLVERIATERKCSVIIPLNLKNEREMQQWELLSSQPVFKMAINAWYIGLVSNHPDFKTKQYFRLR